MKSNVDPIPHTVHEHTKKTKRIKRYCAALGAGRVPNTPHLAGRPDFWTVAAIATVTGILLLTGSWSPLFLDDHYGAWSSVILSVFPDALAEAYGVLGLTAVGSIGDTADLELSGASGIAMFESGGATYAAVASEYDYGVQILNMTDPANPAAVGSIGSTASADLELAGADSIAIFESGGATYAAVTADGDDGVQILSLADPANPAAVGSITDTASLELDGARGITTFESGGTTYAAVASYDDDGLQILNLTDPTNPVAAGRITDNGIHTLDGSSSVAIFKSGGTTYAAVTGSVDDGVQIISLADPANPVARGSIADTASLVLDGANDIAIFKSGGTTYAAVAAFNDNGVQIISLADPANPAALGSTEDDRSLELRGSNAITMFESGGTTYVAVAAFYDNGVQIISLADPANPAAAGNINNNPGLKLKGGSGITTFESGGTTYVAVAAQRDNGVQILGLNHSPSANAGQDQTVDGGDTVTLSGVASDQDSDNLTYAWTHDQPGLGISLANDTALLTTFTAPEVTADTTITFTLTVSDGAESTSDAVSVIIPNNFLSAISAGQDQTVDEGDTVTLFGAASGTDGDPLTYMWTHDRPGLGISLADDAALLTTFTAPEVTADTAVIFTLTVSDGTESTSDAVSVTISNNNPPSVNAGQDLAANKGDTVTLSGTASDADSDPLTYMWTHDRPGLGISLADDAALLTTFTAPEVTADTAVIFTLTADDGGKSSSDTVSVTIFNNHSPSVNASQNQAVDEGDTVTLSGTASDADSDPLTYMWTHDQPGLGISPANDTALLITFTAPEVAADTAVIFTLTASDGTVSTSDTVSVTIKHVPDPHNPDKAFVTTWQTNMAGQNITIPVGGTSGTYTADWGDGTTSMNVTGDQTHVYDDAGTYTVKIYGDFTRIVLSGNSANAKKLQSIEQWGDIQWSSMKSAFREASNMVHRATDAPDLSDVTNTSHMFHHASSFNGDLSDWDVSGVTNMAHMFDDASSFNSDLSDWDVSNVTNMSYMFYEAPSFKSDLSDWDVSGVTNMGRMFGSASSFKSDLSDWDVSNVTNMLGMFAFTSFNSDLSGWDVSKVTDMSGMFAFARQFDSDISDWDVSSVTDMSTMFDEADSFESDLSDWDVSSVTDMSIMFYGADSFNGDISGWDVSSVTDTSRMFNQAFSFNGDISNWNLSSIETMGGMFYRAERFDQNLGNWYIVPSSTSIDYDEAPGVVGRISAQNSYLNGQNPVYRIGSGGDSDSFEISAKKLTLKTAPTKSLYSVTVTATGDFGTSNSKIVAVTVAGVPSVLPPTVDAGTDQTVIEGQTVTLNGTATRVNGGSLTYLWSHDSSLDIQLADSALLSTTFTAPSVTADTTIAFTLTADDGTASSSDAVSVTISNNNNPPTVDAGSDQTVGEGDTVTLSGTASDADSDPLTYTWTHDQPGLGISLANGTAILITFTAPAVYADTEITFTLTADDGTATVADSLVVTVTDVPAVNSPPVADAGPGQIVHENQTATLSGTATDVNGDLLIYSWSHDSTLTIQLANSTSPSTTFTAPAVDADTEITFTLTADDGSANSTDTVLVTVRDADDSDFVTTWETTAPGESITIPARGKYAVYWGDGTADANARHSQTHEYDVPGNHTVRISKGITGINLNNHADASKLQSIDQWGEAKWRSMHSSFKGASNMILHATDAPDLSRTTEMSYMFMHAGSFDGDLSGWDVSGVTGMSGMFYNANSFNGDLSGWDVSGVTGMTGMFYNANSFNGDLSGWDVSGVTGMTGMFYNANSFNGDLSGWDVSHVTDMYSMFSGASSFDGNISAWDVSSVTDMHGMFAAAKSFNGDLSGWDVSGATDMTRMFHNADSFEQNLGPWYIVLDDAAIDHSSIPGEVDRIAAQNSFLGGQNPAYGIGSGGDSAHFELDGNVLKMASIPEGHEGPYSVTITSTGGFGTGNSRTFDIEISGFTDNAPPSVDAGQNQTADEGDTVTLSGTASDSNDDSLTYMWSHDSALTIQLANSTSPSTTFTAPAVDADTTVTFTLTVSDGSANSTDTVLVTVSDVPTVNNPPVADAGLDQAVQEGQAVTLNGTATDDDGDDLTYAWSRDSTMEMAFNASLPAATFVAPLVDADTTVTFTLTVSDGSANSTDTVLVTVSDVPGDPDFVTTWETTASGESITIPARGKYAVDWGDGTVDANVRGSQTHEYDVPGNHTVRISKGITGISLNNHADAPKLQSIDQWGEAKWRSMHSSFKGASNMILHATDAPDLSRTTEMSYMFMHAGSFDGDLSGWDVSGVTGMSGMFYNANSFNGDLSGWDVSGVTGMSGMFYNANSFNGDLSGWDVSGVTGMSGMFYNANSFNGDLSGWDVSHVTDMYSMFSGASSFDGNISAWDVSSVTDMHGMFAAAKSFNGDLSGWDVSGVENMRAMLSNADSFDRNLGKWYITLDGTAVDGDTWAAGTISAQNSFLDDQSPAYGIGTGGDSNLFEINGSVLRLKGAPDRSAGGTYTVTVTSTGDFGASNSRTLEVTVAANPGGIPAEPERGPREIGAVSLNSTAPGTVYVAWEPPSEQPLEYRITWAKSGESFPDWRDPVGNAFPAGSSHTITDLDEGEEYQIKVRARYDSSRPGDWSSVVTITVANTG